MYDRSYIRQIEKSSKLTSIYKRIINEVPLENGVKIVYIDLNDNTSYKTLHPSSDIFRYSKIIFRYEREYNFWSYTKESFFKGKTIEEKRKEHLDYLTDDLFDLRVELGTSYVKILNENKYIHKYIYELLTKRIAEDLEDMYKNKKCDKVFNIKIKNQIYVCMAEHDFSLYYKKIKVFKLKNNEPIYLK